MLDDAPRREQEILIEFKTIQSLSWLCKICWKKLYDFHKFYIRIEKAHLEFGLIIKNEIPNDKNHSSENSTFKSKTPFIDLIILNESYNQLDNSIHELVDDEQKSILKEDNYQELSEDNMPLKQSCKIRNEDPLNKSNKRKRPKTKAKKVKESTKNLNKMNVFEGSEDQKIIEDNYVKQERRKTHISEVTNKSFDLLKTDDDADFDDTNSDSNYEDDKKSLDKNKFQKESNYNHEQNKFLAEHFKITCSLCQISFESFKILRQHFHAEHKQRCYVTCCNKKFSTRCTIVEHIKHHLNPNDFACEQCGKVMSSRACLKLHTKRMHEGKPEKTLFCDICNKGFSKNIGLQTHKAIHLSEEEKRFSCSECSKNFGTNSLLATHVRTVHLKKYIQVCNVCGKCIKSKEVFERHMLEHEGKPAPTISCDICGLLVVNKNGLKLHKEAQHPVGGKQKHICPICSKVSPTIKAHRSHVAYNHKMGFKHKCTICEKAYRKVQELKEHMALHTGDILYTCPWCPRTFNSRSYMHNHRKNCHPKEWEEETRKKYSGNLPPNYKKTSDTNND